MYENLAGKKLLIIGADNNDSEIVRTAQSMGVYTIAVDWSTDRSKSPAKLLADEAWDLNYRDIDALVEKCLAEHVDGVMAGYSETRVLLAARLSKRLGKPFYATEELVEITRDKRSFKSLCAKYCVPIPKEYCADGTWRAEELERLRFPVIVKPSDYGGRFGITICEDASQLDQAIQDALRCSECKKVVVEEFVFGPEMAAIYNLSDGEIALAFVSDKYQLLSGEKSTTLCHATVTPSSHLQQYMETVDPYVRDFLKGIGAKNGVAFFQMIAGEQGIRVFEMGYRLNGENDQHFIEKHNHINHMKMLISYSLTGKMGDDISKNNPAFATYNAACLAYIHAGTVSEVECAATPGADGVIAVTQKAFPGSVIVENFSTQQEALVVKLCADTREELAARIDRVQDGIRIVDTNGANMLFDRFDTRRIFG